MVLKTSGKPYEAGDIFVGLGKRNKPVGVTARRHGIIVGGSRSGKGVGIIIPNLLRWPHNALVIDPKGENAEITYARRKEMGQNVYVLDPFKSAKVPDDVRANFNPLSIIDLKSNRARSTIKAVANGLIVNHDPKHMEWTEGARAILAGIIAFILADAPGEYHNFATVRQLLMRPNGKPAKDGEKPSGLYAEAIAMANDNRVGGLIRDAGIMLMTAIETDKGLEKDSLGQARRATSWLDDEAIAECINGSSFDLNQLRTGKATVFIVLPGDGDFMTDYAGFLRLFVKSTLNIMGRREEGQRCLFILDEFYSLGKLEEVYESLGRQNQYGIQLLPILQDLGQLLKLYGGEGMQAFFASADFQVFFGNNDPTTLDFVSTRLGVVGLDEMPDAPSAPMQSGVSGGAMVSSLANQSRDKYMRQTGIVAGGVLSGLGALAAGLEAADYQNKMNEYQRAMSKLGTPRIPADKLALMIQKKPTDTIAPGMIAFMSGQEPALLKLDPYFDSVMPDPGLKEKQDQKKAEATAKRKAEGIPEPTMSLGAAQALLLLCGFIAVITGIAVAGMFVGLFDGSLKIRNLNPSIMIFPVFFVAAILGIRKAYRNIQTPRE